MCNFYVYIYILHTPSYSFMANAKITLSFFQMKNPICCCAFFSHFIPLRLVIISFENISMFLLIAVHFSFCHKCVSENVLNVILTSNVVRTSTLNNFSVVIKMKQVNYKMKYAHWRLFAMHTLLAMMSHWHWYRKVLCSFKSFMPE